MTNWIARGCVVSLVALVACSTGSPADSGADDPANPTGDDDQQADPGGEPTTGENAGVAPTGSDPASPGASSGGAATPSGAGAGGGTSTAGGPVGPDDPTNVDGWPTYCHDARRTCAADASIEGPLRTAWRYVPKMNSGAPVLYVLNAVAQHDGLYLAFDFFSDAMSNALGFPGIDRINLDGARVWHGGGGRDAGRGNWLAVTSGLVVRNDDGLDVYDAANGNHHPQVAFHGSDSWGQVVPTADRLYLVNTDSNDGPPLHVGAFSLEGNPIWLRNTGGVPPCSEQKWPPPGQYCPTKGIASDLANAIAINANVVFFAGDYHVNSQISQALTSGYYAFDAAAGNQRWFSAGSPTSALSAGNQMVYGIDSGATLFARRATDGSVVWSKAVGGAGRQAPVLAKDLVVVGGAAGVMAFDATTGNAAWVAQLPGAAVPKSTFNAGNGHYGNETVWTAAFVDEQRGKIAPTTTMAAALASSTLVVTAADGIHVLGLADGREQWRGVPDQAQGRLREPIVMGNRVYVIDTPSDAGQAGLIALEGSGAP